jgi:hypothetical protein
MNAVDPIRKMPRMGPESRLVRRGSLGDTFDARSREGKFLVRVEAELLAPLGPTPSMEKRSGISSRCGAITSSTR